MSCAAGSAGSRNGQGGDALVHTPRIMRRPLFQENDIMRKLLAGAAVLALTVTAHAQSQMPNTSGGAPNPMAQGTQAQSNQAQTQNQKVSAATKQFVQKAAVTDMFEIEAGQLAQQKASSEDYKEFGQMIVNDHQQASGQLKSIAQNIQGIEVPSALDSAHQQKMTKLQSLSGAHFETQFKSDQVAGHQQAVKLFQDYSRSGDNPELKQFAQQILPKLQEHLKHAQALPKPGAAPTVGSGRSSSP
jgi:putative membrane protein